jgi:hypothetical protein
MLRRAKRGSRSRRAVSQSAGGLVVEVQEVLSFKGQEAARTQTILVCINQLAERARKRVLGKTVPVAANREIQVFRRSIVSTGTGGF